MAGDGDRATVFTIGGSGLRASAGRETWCSRPRVEWDMSNKSELYAEAKRCSSEAEMAETPKGRKLLEGLARFYNELARTEPDPPVMPNCPPCGLDLTGGKIELIPKNKRRRRARS